MVARCFFMMMILLGVVTSCSPRQYRMKETADRLAAGMTKAQVAELFQNFESQEVKDNQIGMEIVRFQPNVEPATVVTYMPKENGVYRYFEVCVVFFDTNNVIVGYKYKHS